MSEDNAAVRNLRNFTTIIILALIVLTLCFYVTGTLVIATINGKWEVIKGYYKLNLDKQLIYLFKTMKAYWQFYFTNYETLTFEKYSYFVPKLWITTLFPYTFLLSLGFIFRAPIMDWRPFKKPESIHGSAKWASMGDVKKMGLRAKSGVLLGMYNKKMLTVSSISYFLHQLVRVKVWVL